MIEWIQLILILTGMLLVPLVISMGFVAFLRWIVGERL